MITKYIVLEGCDEEEISFVGFADNYVQAYAMTSNRLKEAEEVIRNGSNNKNTTIDNSEVKVLNMSNGSGYKVLQRLDVHTMVEETKAVVSYTLVKMMYIISYDSEVQTSTTNNISDPEQLDMFTYMKGGYKDGESN